MDMTYLTNAIKEEQLCGKQSNCEVARNQHMQTGAHHLYDISFFAV